MAKKPPKRRTYVVVYAPQTAESVEWEVWLSDMIEPGTHVASAKTRDNANRTGVLIGMRTQSRVLLVKRDEESRARAIRP